MKKYILEINGLIKNFNRLRVLNDVSFKIKSGDFFGLIGPNGAGKSTLLKILYGIVIPDSGNISINGLDLPSNIINEGLLINDLAIISLLFNPPESSETLEYFFSPISKKLRSSFARLRDSPHLIPEIFLLTGWTFRLIIKKLNILSE